MTRSHAVVREKKSEQCAGLGSAALNFQEHRFSSLSRVPNIYTCYLMIALQQNECRILMFLCNSMILCAFMCFFVLTTSANVGMRHEYVWVRKSTCLSLLHGCLPFKQSMLHIQGSCGFDSGHEGCIKGSRQ